MRYVVMTLSLGALLSAQPARVAPPATATPAVPVADAPPEPLGVDYMKSHYTKYEYEIPVRDGKKLFTAVYVPKDATGTYPMMLMRTPYSVGPYGVDNY